MEVMRNFDQIFIALHDYGFKCYRVTVVQSCYCGFFNPLSPQSLTIISSPGVTGISRDDCRILVARWYSILTQGDVEEVLAF